ncbi:hypothetical protein ACULNC_13945 [Shigella flexneri]
MIFNTFPQEARLAVLSGHRNPAQRQSDTKIRMINHPEHNVHTTIKIRGLELYATYLKRHIGLHHIDHDMSKVSMTALMPSCLPAGIHKFQQEINVYI